MDLSNLRFGQLNELNFQSWNANWPVKSEAKMAAHGGQFWTSVPIPYAGLYFSFSLPLDILDFLKIFLIESTHKTCLQKMGMSLRISNKFQQSQTSGGGTGELGGFSAPKSKSGGGGLSPLQIFTGKI